MELWRGRNLGQLFQYASRSMGRITLRPLPPVKKMITIRALLVVAAMKDWLTYQMDVTNAFLHGDLFEHVYMKLPQGYTHLGSRIAIGHQPSTDAKKVCKFKKSLYRLKQASRQWFSKLPLTLISFSFVQSMADYSLFTKHHNNNITLILIYVDDLLTYGNNGHNIQHLKDMLSTSFHMKDLGILRYFLGLNINRNQMVSLSHKKSMWFIY